MAEDPIIAGSASHASRAVSAGMAGKKVKVVVEEIIEDEDGLQTATFS
ncbi:hypothetical protein [Arcanobacterium bovis]|nr:hypothetical protein [Arcanobacterium bovis]